MSRDCIYLVADRRSINLEETFLEFFSIRRNSLDAALISEADAIAGYHGGHFVDGFDLRPVLLSEMCLDCFEDFWFLAGFFFPSLRKARDDCFCVLFFVRYNRDVRIH